MSAARVFCRPGGSRMHCAMSALLAVGAAAAVLTAAQPSDYGYEEPGSAVAESRPPPRVVHNPFARPPAPPSGEAAAEPASHEVWISSDEPRETLVAQPLTVAEPEPSEGRTLVGRPHVAAGATPRASASLRPAWPPTATAFNGSPVSQEGISRSGASAVPESITAPAEEGDQWLFRTTSAPPKPASLVFRPERKAGADRVAVRGPSPVSAVRAPPSLADEPGADVGSGAPADPLVAGRPIRRPAGAVQRPLVGDPGGPLEGRIADDSEGLRRKPGSSGEVVPQIVLRVRIAELNRATAPTLGFNFKRGSSQSKPLLKSLLEAGNGDEAAVLSSMAVEDAETGLAQLQQQGEGRVRSERTLITTSGRGVTFLARGDQPRAPEEEENQVERGRGDFLAAVTLLPVVTGDDEIRLEVASEVTRLDPGSKSPGETTPTLLTHAQLVTGETLVVGDLLGRSRKGGRKRPLPVLGGILGALESGFGGTELVMLVTPELVRPAGRGASLAGSGDKTSADGGSEVYRPRVADRPIAGDGQVGPPSSTRRFY